MPLPVSTLPGDITAEGVLTGASVVGSDLTATRVVYVGASGLLVDSASLTFDGTNLGVGTLVLASGSITDSSGSISFVNENLATTGTLASGTHTISSTLVLASGSITDSSGAITFVNENLSTTGLITGGTGHFGGVTHYSDFEADGTLKFNGNATVWKDTNLGSAQTQQPAASAPSKDTFTDNAGADTDIATLAFGVGDKVGGTFEIQHDYKEGSDIYFHVHFQCDAAPSDTDYVAWELDYTVVRDGATMAATTNISTGDVTIDTQYEQYRGDWAAVTGSSLLHGDHVSFKLSRVAAAGAAYAGDCKLKTVGMHYEIDTVGSRTSLAK